MGSSAATLTLNNGDTYAPRFNKRAVRILKKQDQLNLMGNLVNIFSNNVRKMCLILALDSKLKDQLLCFVSRGQGEKQTNICCLQLLKHEDFFCFFDSE